VANTCQKQFSSLLAVKENIFLSILYVVEIKPDIVVFCDVIVIGEI
jgi:hypothetical protein